MGQEEVTAPEAPEVKFRGPAGDLYKYETLVGLVFLLQNGLSEFGASWGIWGFLQGHV